jgi:hypothetical protein
MPTEADLARLNALDFAARFRPEMVPLSNKFSYFSALPMSEEDLKEYLHEPIAAIPPAIKSGLPKISVLLVPYLEKPAGKAGEFVTFEKPSPRLRVWSAQFLLLGDAVLVFAVKDQEVAEYHYVLYHGIAALVADHFPAESQEPYQSLLREEVRARVHGEVDEAGWELKQVLLRRQGAVRHDTKAFRAYARQSFLDTVTLYLHGLCCDIDVDTGPRQLPSRFLRKRLQLLYDSFPPPEGYALFPEQLSKP